jgi:hypothetical protein
MYKTQFKRWGWFKYNCKTSRRDIASGRQLHNPKIKPSQRHNGLPTPARSPAQASTPVATTIASASPRTFFTLNHGNDTSLRIEKVLSDLGSHIKAVYDPTSSWAKTQAYDVLNAYDHYGLYDTFRLGLNEIDRGDLGAGFHVIGSAIPKVEETMQSDLSGSFYCLFIELSSLLLQEGRIDILKQLVGYIADFTEIKLPNSSLHRIFTDLYRFIREEKEPSELRRCVTMASRLWTDSLTEQRGVRDRSTMIARRNYIRHAGDESEYSVTQLISEYEGLHQEAVERYGAGHHLALHLEDVVLMTQHNYNVYQPDFEQRCRGMIASREAKYAEANVPIREWDLVDRVFYSNAYVRLARYFELKGDGQRAAECKERHMEGWNSEFWLEEVERLLEEEDRVDEAKWVRFCRLEVQYYTKHGWRFNNLKSIIR